MPIIKHIILLSIITQILNAANESLERDIADGYLDDHTKVEAAFILSGAPADSMDYYLDWYNDLLNSVKSFNLEFNDPAETARVVFTYLHSQWLKTYAKESTTLIDITRNKEYNCVAATILYNLICEDLTLTCEAFETPTHVYTIFNDFNKKLIVENTNNMGFDIMSNLKAYSKYLAQYYPQSDVLKIGLDRLYYHENSKGRPITNTELLGLLAYNRAYFAREEKDYEMAYEYVLLAQQFNQDSRSNYNFEIGLYYDWGHQLYETKKYTDAFAVFADAYYRYPDNKDFLNNTFVTFFNSLNINWQKKVWPESARLIEEMIDLKILQANDRKHLEALLFNWLQYFKSIKDDKSLNEIKQLLETLKE